MTAPWPAAGWGVDAEAERAFALVQEIVRAVRALRAELRVPPGSRVRVLLRGAAPSADQERLVRDLARAQAVEYRDLRAGEQGVAAVVGAGVEVLLPLEGVVDVGAEVRRLRDERQTVELERARVRARLEDASFRERAKPEVVERQRRRLTELEAALARLDDRLAQLERGRRRT